VVALLKDDFESFFEREAWFRKMRLPFRRGYLLHGPPGNGKSTAIRAMMTSRGLTAYTIRFFDEHVDDSCLDSLFARAAKEAPAIVLLEDIDRSFPRTGPSKTKISLQQLLNCLDGVASGEGIITIATANEPTALDPAILRRPGRFDRVVAFADPTPELRHQYFVRMHPAFACVNLDEAVEQSAGFSFAQLREAFIMAAQTDFSEDGVIDLDDLLNSIWSLRGSLSHGSMKPSAGFAVPRPVKRGNHD
jgi:chaperone BCS1